MKRRDLLKLCTSAVVAVCLPLPPEESTKIFAFCFVSNIVIDPGSLKWPKGYVHTSPAFSWVTKGTFKNGTFK